MTESLFLGMFLLVLSGVTGGSFYVPLGKVKHWSWETYWLIMGIPAWVIIPWMVAWLTVPHLLEVFANSPMQSLAWTFLFGVMWGIGAVTFGLTMRYLGISLGMAITVGLIAAFGTLIPPIVDGTFIDLLRSSSGLTGFAGVAVCLLGIAIYGWAGICKERELTDQQKKESVKEFALGKGFVVGIICGVTSACFVYGLNAGEPIAKAAIAMGTPDVYQNNPALILVMGGGFIVNSIWCLALNISNRSIRQYVSVEGGVLLKNYLLVCLAAIIWYGSMLFYGMAITQMGEFAFLSWSIQQALIIVCGSIWGIFLNEWKGVSRWTWFIFFCGNLVLIISTIIMAATSAARRSCHLMETFVLPFFRACLNT